MKLAFIIKRCKGCTIKDYCRGAYFRIERQMAFNACLLHRNATMSDMRGCCYIYLIVFNFSYS